MGSDIHRAIYFQIKDDYYYITHGFIKKTFALLSKKINNKKILERKLKIEKKHVLFNDWLEEHLENETDEYRDAYEKEKFKLELAIQIKKIRTEQKLSQREFAEKVGIAQSTLANIELGNAEPNIDTMYKIGAKNDKKLVISYE